MKVFVTCNFSRFVYQTMWYLFNFRQISKREKLKDPKQDIIIDGDREKKRGKYRLISSRKVKNSHIVSFWADYYLSYNFHQPVSETFIQRCRIWRLLQLPKSWQNAKKLYLTSEGSCRQWVHQLLPVRAQLPPMQ